jgi:hypothetical protein
MALEVTSYDPQAVGRYHARKASAEWHQARANGQRAAAKADGLTDVDRDYLLAGADYHAAIADGINKQMEGKQ